MTNLETHALCKHSLLHDGFFPHDASHLLLCLGFREARMVHNAVSGEFVHRDESVGIAIDLASTMG